MEQIKKKKHGLGAGGEHIIQKRKKKKKKNTWNNLPWIEK